MLKSIASFIYERFLKSRKEPYVKLELNTSKDDCVDTLDIRANFNNNIFKDYETLDTERSAYVEAVRNAERITFSADLKSGRQVYTLMEAPGYFRTDKFTVCYLKKGNTKTGILIGDVRLMNSVYFSFKKQHLEDLTDAKAIIEAFFKEMKPRVMEISPKNMNKEKLEQEIKNWKVT